MVCYSTCAIATGFIGSSLSIMFSTQKNLLSSQFVETLDDKQKAVYFKIVKERFNIYIQGTILGIILSVIFYFYGTRNNLSNRTLICSTIVIIGLTQYLYYILMPKTDMILDHLNNNTQVRAWSNIYKYMQRQFHLGFLLGLVGYGLLVKANI